MSRRVLAQAGVSLADVYDVEGSIVGIDSLDVDDIKGVHEMGGTIHSERLNVFTLIADSTAIAQSTTFGIVLGGIPNSINRVLAVAAMCDDADRLNHCSWLIEDPDSDVEFPIWNWEESVAESSDFASQVLWNPGSGVVQEFMLRSGNAGGWGMPTFLAPIGVSRAMPNLVFRGQSIAFGAGTVRVRGVMMIARPNSGNPPPGEPSSFGLPMPSW